MTDAFARADDKLQVNGADVLDYEQASNKARALSPGEANAATDCARDHPRGDRRLRGRSKGSRPAAGTHTTLTRCERVCHLAPQSLSTVTIKLLRGWRDGLVKAGMLPDTLNRVLRPARAAFNLAAKFDQRVSANTEAWREGLERLPNDVKARNAVLTEKQVLAVVSAAYDISEQFGLYVQCRADIGSRSSELARCLGGDLHGGVLMVPASRKGRNGGRGRPYRSAADAEPGGTIAQGCGRQANPRAAAQARRR